jgi:ethanolamine ammonia-lyase small subunit
MRSLREFTMARVGLARAGHGLATSEILRFQLAHAQARDAVHYPLDVRSLQIGQPVILLHSAAPDRATYLRRPDLGRRLGVDLPARAEACDLVIIIADGLSALAVHRHAPAVLDHLIPLFDDSAWSRAPLCIVEQGRVAIGDEIGQRLRASLALVLIGERPGLSSPDSLGAYLTWRPAPGRTDAERNCISNIRPEGLGYEDAAQRIFALATAARGRGLTGVALKEGSLLCG